MSAHVCDAPVATVVAAVIPFTTTGLEDVSVFPFPNCPSVLSPQQCTVPFSRRAQLWRSPTDTEMAVVMSSTGTSSEAPISPASPA